MAHRVVLPMCAARCCRRRSCCCYRRTAWHIWTHASIHFYAEPKALDKIEANDDDDEHNKTNQRTNKQNKSGCEKILLGLHVQLQWIIRSCDRSVHRIRFTVNICSSKKGKLLRFNNNWRASTTHTQMNERTSECAHSSAAKQWKKHK